MDDMLISSMAILLPPTSSESSMEGSTLANVTTVYTLD